MPGAMRHSIEHLYALDVACGGGLEIEIDGKTWTLSPLTFGDSAKIMVRARSEAMRAYNEASKGADIGVMQRSMDINAILFGAAPQHAFTDPATRRYQVELSLRRGHAKEPEHEIQAVLVKLFDDEETAGKLATDEIVEALTTMTHGPFTEADLKPDKDGAENPTNTEAP